MYRALSGGAHDVAIATRSRCTFMTCLAHTLTIAARNTRPAIPTGMPGAGMVVSLHCHSIPFRHVDLLRLDDETSMDCITWREGRM